MRLPHAAIAHRAKKEPFQFPAPPRSDDEECRSFRLVQKDLGGIAANDSCPHVLTSACRNGVIDDLVQLDLRFIDERVEIFDVYRYVERSGTLRERPRGDHLERDPPRVA
jgi:hypothetical protein